MTKQLKISLLGGVTITLNSKPVSALTSQKATALLIYLACNPRPVPRDVLANLLYGNLAQKRARANLRTLLSRLRPLSEYLIITRQSVSFDTQKNYHLDIEVLADQLSQTNLTSPTETLSIEGVSRLQNALALYRGDFLAGFSIADAPEFEEWAIVEQERLYHLALIGLDKLVTYYVEQNQYQEGIKQASRLLQLDPLREASHRQMMLLLARSGQRSAALAQYELCQRSLQTELGLSPAPETTALYERIQALGVANQSEAEKVQAVRPHNIPRALSPLMGRDEEMQAAIARLNSADCTLLTILGPGGVGKTRLALEVAHTIALDERPIFRQGVYFVPLSDVHSPSSVISAIAGALNFSFQAEHPPQVELLNYLGGKEILLILDNFEHLLDSPSPPASTFNLLNWLLDLLAQTPGIKIILTSRERLNVRIEWLQNLGGLSYLPQPRGLPAPAMRLFESCARRVQSDFSLEKHFNPVAEIACLTAGFPLAIELAAASTQSFLPAEIASQLQKNLDFLASAFRDIPERHRSLRAVFEHSWQLLDSQEQSVFMRLSVFRGGFTAQAALETLDTNLAMLSNLVYKSLIYLDSAGRYHIHQLIKQYAAQKLAESASTHDELLIAYSAYFSHFLAQRGDDLRGPRQAVVRQEISLEISNIRQFWEWAIERLSEPRYHSVVLLHLRQAVEALYQFYLVKDWYQEGERIFHHAAVVITETEQSLAENDAELEILLGQVLAYQGKMVEVIGNPDKAEQLFQESITILHRHTALNATALALRGLGYVSHQKGAYGPAQKYLEESLRIYQSRNNGWGEASVFYLMSLIARRQGDFATASEQCRQSLYLRREIGDHRGEAASLNMLGLIQCDLGEYSQAKTTLEQGLEICQAIDFKIGIANAITGLLQPVYYMGDYETSEALARQCLEIYQDIGDKWGEAIAYNNLGELAFRRGDFERAKEVLSKSLNLYRQIGVKSGLAYTLSNLAGACLGLNQNMLARTHLLEALQIAWEIQAIPNVLEALTIMADLFFREGEAEKALRLCLCVLSQSAALEETKTKVKTLTEQLKAKLSTAQIAQIEKAAGDYSLEGVMAGFLDM